MRSIIQQCFSAITARPLLGCMLVAGTSLLLANSSVMAQPAAAPVRVVPVAESTIFNELQLIGTVTSPQVAMLSSQINGLVAQVNADDGDVVAAGDVLLQLDPELAALQLASADATVEQASKALADARRRLQEARVLVKDRSIAASTVRDLEAEVAMDEAALHQAEAQAGYQRALLARHTLRAPFGGVVSQKLVEQGEWVATGTGVFELVATDNLRLDFYVAEDYLSRVDRNGELRFRLGAYPDQEYRGVISTIVPVTEPGARTFLLRVAIDPAAQQPATKLIPGMSVNATLQVPTGRTGLVVPRDATLRNQDGRITVWTLDERDGSTVVTENRVETGLVFAGQVEIRSGLAANARVVVTGNEALRNGQRVEVISR